MINTIVLKLRNSTIIIKLTIFIIIFSLLISWLIYWREAPIGYGVTYFETLFWQLLIWLPWIFIVLGINFLRYKTLNINKYIRILIFGISYGLILYLHWLWFLIYSKNFSPYLGSPHENYGVFPYFFIFWSLIDFIFLIVITIFFLEKELLNTKENQIKEFTLKVKRGGTNVLLKSNDIYWVSAEGYYINIHTNQGKFLLRRTLKSLLDSLPITSFIRIHRSAIVNVYYVNELKKSSNKGLIVLLKDGNSHSVSRTYIKNFKEMLRKISV